MSLDNPFLQALLADPDDDTLRLAMADWFEENDDPERAEFIRVQIELARGVPDRDRLRELRLSQRRLLIAHELEWTAPLARALERPRGTWGGWVFRRGFAEYFHLPASLILRCGERLASLTPLRELYLLPASAQQVIELLDRSFVANLTALYLPATELTPPAMEALLESPLLGRLRVLRYNALQGEHGRVLRFQSRLS
jgi:uncharacterized protein (TIGR02996 family)